MKSHLLVVDDDDDIRAQMRWALADEYEVLAAGDRDSALQALSTHPCDVVLLDLGLPPAPNDTTEGLRALEQIVGRDRLTKVIVITGQGEKENALAAIGGGAYDFLCKPIDTAEVRTILRRASYVARLEREHRRLLSLLDDGTFEQMIGSSPMILDAFAVIRKVSTSDAPVLLLGESGTGKEMAARAIHRRSARRERPFVPINCAAIPANLLESELFGHEKGSFTGATAQRKGRIESASGGTLFLDEIAELSPDLQVKLLRFLQERTIERVGGREPIPIDARVVAATNADLDPAMRDGRFREDLYYRLAVVVLRLPPLRERHGDIPLLAKAFLRKFAAESGSAVKGFSRDAVRAMEDHAWPGNIREMENRVRRAVIMADGPQIAPADLELPGGPGSPGGGATLREAREALERDMVERALRRNSGNVSRAAADLGVSRPTLYELIQKLGLKA